MCTGPLTGECHRSTEPYDGVCGARGKVTYYCSAALVAACGTGVCPDTQCLFNHVDRVNGGTYWCCP